jgi:hypothetical protein
MFEDAMASLDRCAEEVARLRGEPHAIKWTLLSMHSALQGFMALILEQGNGLLLMPKKDMIEWQKAHYAGNTYPTGQMDTFLNLYAKIKRKESMPGAAPFKTIGHTEAMKELNALRNQFIHFNISGIDMTMQWYVKKT